MPVLYSQGGPDIWVFGRNAGLDFNSGQAVPVTYPTENCYSPSASQCDAAGNLLFYCDGRDIKDKNGQAMPGSENPVWQAPVHIARIIMSNIVPVPGDTNRYYVFMLSPSSGQAPYGTYYYGALTYSVVDMRLNNGTGGIDPAFSNILIGTELRSDMIVVPGNGCNYWLITYKQFSFDNGQFAAYHISEQGVAAPVYSGVSLAGYPYPFVNMQMVYAYKHHKIIAWVGGRILFKMDFDPATGIVSEAKLLQDLIQFRNAGGGISVPSVCLSPKEQFLYLLGYPASGAGPGISGITLLQYSIDLTDPNLTLPISAANLIFSFAAPEYQVPSASVPYVSQTCDIRTGPDDKVYVFYNTAQSFLGVVNQPDNPGLACNFSPQGTNLLPNTYGSYYFPAIENKPFTTTVNYSRKDTSLCFSAPFTLKSRMQGNGYTFLWNDGSTMPDKQVTQAGTYWVKATGDCLGAQQVDTFVVAFEPPEKCNCTLFVPTAFSPNKDNLNDIFQPVLPLTCMKGSYRLAIYNRWGESVFQSYDILKGWDGTIKGNAAELGVYHYAIRYRDNQEQEQHFKGTLTLLR